MTPRLSAYRSAPSYLPSGSEFTPHLLQQQMEGDNPPPPAGTPPAGDAPPPEFVTKADFQNTANIIRTMNESLLAMKTGGLTLDSLAAMGLIDKDEEGNYKPKAAPPPPAPKAPEDKTRRDDNDPVVLRLKKLEKELTDAREAKDISEKKIAEGDRNAAIMSALSEAGAMNAKRDFVHLSSSVEKNDSGYFVKGSDAYGNPVEVGLKDAAEKYLKDNPELKRASNTGGAATPAAGHRAAAGMAGSKIVPKSQWGDMSYMMLNRAKFDSGELVRGE